MRLLYIAASDPYQSARAQTLLDALLVAASFGAEVSVLFQGPGLLQLLPGHASAALGKRSLPAQLSALPLFDVDRLYVDDEDAQRYDLTLAQDIGNLQPLERAELAGFLRQFDQVIRL